MSLREIFGALGRGWWIILLVAAVALGVAYAAVVRIEPTFSASGTVRSNPFLSAAILNGQIVGVTVDLDPSVIPTPVILEPAAESLGVDAQTLGGAVQYAVESGSSTSALTVSAIADDARDAPAYAEAVLAAYTDYVTQTVASVAETVQVAVTAAAGQVQAQQALLAANPADQLTAQNLTAALAELSSQTGRLSEVQNAGNLLTVVGPVGGAVSSAPDPLSILGVALLCGVLAGAGIVLIIDRLDDRIRSVDEVEELLQVGVLGELPYDRTASRRRRRNRLPAATGRQGVLGERLRSLRTSVDVLLPGGKGVVVLTSVEPGDGKTFISSNLAVSWARAGRKAILVGGDMRRPQIGEYFPDTVGRPGLSDLLSPEGNGRRSPTQAQIDQSLVSSSFRGLRVLPPGSETDDAADLLGTSNTARVLGFASRVADIVVVDSPPALALADASELARAADGVVLVITMRRTRRRLLRAAADTLSGNDVVLLGVVVNRTRGRLPRTYAAYYTSASGSYTSRRRRLPLRRSLTSRRRDEPVESATTAPGATHTPVRYVTTRGTGDGLSGSERREAALAGDDADAR